MQTDNIEAGTSNLRIKSTKTISACPWNINVTFECIVHGKEGDTTVWQGTAFSGCNNDEITLIHNRFGGEGASGMCNGGAITGWIVNVTMGDDSNHSVYTSQLVVIVRSEMIGKSIKCIHDNGLHEIHDNVGSTNLTMNVNASAADSSIICMHTSKSDSESGHVTMNATSLYMGTIKGIMS